MKRDIGKSLFITISYKNTIKIFGNYLIYFFSEIPLHDKKHSQK